MIFYSSAKRKPSNSIGFLSGCMLLIGFGAIIFFLSLLDDIEDLSDYWFQLVLVTLMGGSVLYGVFRKKGKMHNSKVTIKNDYFHMGKFSTPLNKINLDIYYSNDQFNRYHIWDNAGVVAIYSVYQDELIDYLKEALPEQTQTHLILKSSSNQITAHDRSLSYDLDTGEYTIQKLDGEPINVTPKIYAYDRKYQQ